MLSDMTKWDPDIQVRTMDEAIRILRGRGCTCRLFAQPHAWDSILVNKDGHEFHFTPWFFEADGSNFAVGEPPKDNDPDDDGYTIDLKVAFDDGQGLADVILGWLSASAVQPS